MIPDEYRGFFVWAIRNHGPLLQHKDKDGWTPLYEAIRQKNHEFVELVIAHACDVRGLLGAANKGQNCLHLAISERSPLTRTIISEIQRSDERKSPFSTGAGGGVNRARHVQNSTDAGGFFTMHGLDDKMTPLHLAADMEQYDSDDKPYQFGRDAALPSRTLTNHIKSEVPPNRIIRRATGGAETPSRDPNPRPEDARLAATLGDETSWTPSNGVSPSQTADRAVARDDNSTTIHLNGAPTGTPTATKGPQSFDLVDIVQRLVAASPRVLVDYVDKDGKTPFQLRLETLQDEDPRRGVAASSMMIASYSLCESISSAHLTGRMPSKPCIESETVRSPTTSHWRSRRKLTQLPGRMHGGSSSPGLHPAMIQKESHRV